MSNQATRRRTNSSIVIAVVLILLVAVGGWRYLSDRFGPRGTEQHGNVAIPAASTDPRDVVTTLVEAFNVCDHRTIRALTSTDYNSIALGWCNSGIHDLKVESSNVHSDGGGVSLIFKVRHGDASLPSGSTVYWTFGVGRSSDGKRWVVTNGGQTGS